MELFETLKNIIIGIIIGFLYYLLIFKVTDSIFIDENPTDRIQKSVLTIYIISVISIFMANTLLSDNPKFKNNMMKYGILSGSIFLLYNTIILSWDSLDNNNKIIILSLSFGLILWYIYSKKEKLNIELDKEISLDKKKLSKLKRKLKRHLEDTS